MILLRGLSSGIVLMLLLTQSLSAQVPETLRVLALPEGQPIMCRVPVLDSATHPALRQFVSREFFFGSPPSPTQLGWSREIQVAFDSAGRAVLMADDVNFGIRGGESVVAVADSTGHLVGTRIDVTVDSAAIQRPIALGDLTRGLDAVRRPVKRALSSEENKQLSLLATWLWNRRCRR